jgi:hypothetical protein
MFPLDIEKQELPRLREIERDAASGVFLLIDKHVPCRVAANPMSPKLIRADRSGFVADVEEGLIVSGEHKIGGNIFDAFVDQLAGRKLAHKGAEFAVTVKIDGECDALVIRTDGP